MPPAPLPRRGSTVRLAAKRIVYRHALAVAGLAAGDVETLVGKSDNLADRGLLNARLPDDYRGLDLISGCNARWTC